jgi:hypothetical protein
MPGAATVAVAVMPFIQLLVLRDFMIKVCREQSFGILGLIQRLSRFFHNAG